ncbi:MAG: exopolysaccharide biosynthesis polyprenyl glycosylphosphotransferase [Acidobacteria bacterium]|nr:exopolysaccharide biosynthesis polyprenyl glycosylphosphotransferase [Acidobacteriota bacterium]
MTTTQAPLRGQPRWVSLLRMAVLMASDLAAVALSCFMAYLLWAHPVRHQSLAMYRPLFPLVLLFPLSYLQAGLYPGFGLGAVETLRLLSVRTSFVFVAVAAMTFALKLSDVFSRMTVAIAWGLSLATVPLLRYLVLGLVRRLAWWAEPVLIIGCASIVRSLTGSLSRSMSIGYRPVAQLLVADEEAAGHVGVLPVLGTLEDAPAVASRGFNVALIAEEQEDRHWKLLEYVHQYFRHVIVLRPVGGTPLFGVTVRNFGDVFGLEFTNELLKRRNRIVKRTVDVFLGSVGLVAGIPVMALAALGVQLFSRGPVFFVQEREGLGGRTIRVWKLRTMVPGAERRLREHLAADREVQREWEGSFKLRRDPRLVPVVGRLLRRFSIDELPQLVNVVRGDMSLVGPRPFPPYHLRRFSPGFRNLRRQVRPGVTGLWQVLGRGRGGLADQEALDTHYIRNWSLWMDLYVMAKTVVAVLGGRGAF